MFVGRDNRGKTVLIASDNEIKGDGNKSCDNGELNSVADE